MTITNQRNQAAERQKKCRREDESARTGVIEQHSLLARVPGSRLLSTKRSGMALLLCLFVIGITSILTIGILETIMIQQTAVRHSVDYERAFYLAGAGAHHVLAELEANPAWRGAIGPIELPKRSGNFYSARAMDGSASTVIVTAEGSSAGAVHKINVTVRP